MASKVLVSVRVYIILETCDTVAAVSYIEKWGSKIYGIFIGTGKLGTDYTSTLIIQKSR